MTGRRAHNIATVSHCITRLRCAPPARERGQPKIEQLPMVKGCFTNAGQFQVVIGTEVGDYYNAAGPPAKRMPIRAGQKPLART